MAAVIGALRAEISATIAKFREDMKAAGAEVRNFVTHADAQGRRLQRIGRNMSLAITAPLVAFGIKSVQAATQSAQALGQLDAALKSTEHQAGRTLKQLQAQAKALESISTFDDDDILAQSTTNLLKFGNVVGQVFDRASLAIVNMASRTGDLASATQTVGRALNDPINGLQALTRAGVQFTNQEKEKIKALVQSGRGVEAQALILEKLERAYDGAAKALRDATPTAALNQQWRDLTEIVGGILINVLPPVIDLLRSVAEAFNTLSPEMQRLTVYAGLFAAALGPLAIVIGSVLRIAAAVAPIIKGLSVALAGITVVTWGWVAAITAVVAALVIFWRSVRKLLVGDFAAAWEEAKKTARDMWADLKSMFANDPIQAPIEVGIKGAGGEIIAPGKTNFNLGAGGGGIIGGDSGTIPDVDVTPMVEIHPDFWHGMSQEMESLIRFQTDRLVQTLASQREAVATQEAMADLHMRRGDEGFLSDEMMQRLQIARDLTDQELVTQERIARLKGELQLAELQGDASQIENLNRQIILEEQLLALVQQTTVEQIRREERLQEAVGTFIDRFESDLMEMLKNWDFSLKGLGEAFKQLLMDILVKPHVSAAGDALGAALKIGIGALGGALGFGGGGAAGGRDASSALLGMAEGGFIPPSQWSVVGEDGPELAFGGRTGLRVFSNEDSRTMAGGGMTIVQNIRTQDSYSFMRTSRQVARQTKRVFQEAS